MSEEEKKTIKIPDELPLTISTGPEFNVGDPQNADEWVMTQVLLKGKAMIATIGDESREVEVIS